MALFKDKNFFKKDGEGADGDKKPASTPTPAAGGKFGGLIKASTSSSANDGVKSIADRIAEGPKESSSSYFGKKEVKLAILLDTTGSMQDLISLAKESVVKIMDSLDVEAKGVEVLVQIFEYKDYSVYNKTFTSSPLTTDKQVLKTWISGLYASGGNGDPEGSEAIEAPLQEILEKHNFQVLILAGDARSHTAEEIREYNQVSLTALELAQKFGIKGVPIHTFLVGDDPVAERDFKQISEASKGIFGRISTQNDDFMKMVILSVLEKAKGTAAVAKYLSTNILTGNSMAFGQLLLGEGKKQ